MRGCEAAEGDAGQAGQRPVPQSHVPGQDEAQHLRHGGRHRGEGHRPLLCAGKWGGAGGSSWASLPPHRLPQALCSLLRRDASINFKAKGNSLVSVLACNLLMAAYEEDENWPEIFVKVSGLSQAITLVKAEGCDRGGRTTGPPGG